ncbi:hypothetical protein DIPPA_08852 [Diplonema papillatum]|nr:hypothetical protein DIPPA_08852 [Diplonema papillatum]
MQKGINVADLVSMEDVARGSDNAIKEFLKLTLTSMFASSRVDDLGTQVMSLSEEEDTEDLPEKLMAIMQEVQTEHGLDPSELENSEDDEEANEAPVSAPVPVKANRSRVHADPSLSPPLAASPPRSQPGYGLTRTAADYEEEIAQLHRLIKEKESDVAQLVMTNSTLREEKNLTEVKYQQLYDKQFSMERERELEEQQNASRVATEKLRHELTDRDVRIAEFEKKLLEYKVKEDEWQNTADEFQIALHDLSEARKEADKVEQIREQREKVTKERNFYKSNVESLESKLDEEVQKSTRLQAELSRSEQKVKKADEMAQEKVLTDVKLTDALKRLTEAQEQLAPLKAELAASQRNARQLTAEAQQLKEDLNTAREQADSGGDTLADELSGPDKEAVHEAKRKVLELQEELREKEEEVSTLQGTLESVTQAKDALEKQAKLSAEQLADAEAMRTQDLETAQNQVTTASNEKTTRLQEELRLKQDEHELTEQDLAALKSEMLDLKMSNEQETKALQKKIDAAEARLHQRESYVADLEEKMRAQKEAYEKELDDQRAKHEKEKAKAVEDKAVALATAQAALRSANSSFDQPPTPGSAPASGPQKPTLKSKQTTSISPRSPIPSPLAQPSNVPRLSGISSSTKACDITDVGALQATVTKLQSQLDERNKELKRITSIYYTLGKAAVKQQVGHFTNSSQPPQSWLARKKHEIHSFAPCKVEH